MPDVVPSPLPSHRLPALDAMRGLVMVLMAVDHVDAVANPRHASADGAWMGDRGALSPPDFLTRWCSHLCAPTFVFLAGCAVALAAARRGAGGAGAFDRHLAIRAGVLLAIELVVLSTCFRIFEGGFDLAFASPLPVFLQVIYAIGLSMLLLVPLRRLPAAAQVGLAGALLVACDLLRGTAPDEGAGRFVGLLLFEAGVWSRDGRSLDAIVLYPVLPWLAVMLLGHATGRRLARAPLGARAWLAGGLVCLAGFAALRFADGFGNLGMHRQSGGVLAWLHCSKYPPSLTFLAMELGLMALFLASLTARAARAGPPTLPGRALLVLGRVPLFFYLLHLSVIGLLAGIGVFDRARGSWLTSWIGAALLTAACLPVCLAYARYKRRGHAWTRYL